MKVIYEFLNTTENKLCSALGSIAGVGSYLASLDNGQFYDKLVSSCIIAFCAGAIGLLGKFTIELIINIIKNSRD
jgi:hypothetical protein